MSFCTQLIANRWTENISDSNRSPTNWSTWLRPYFDFEPTHLMVTYECSFNSGQSLKNTQPGGRTTHLPSFPRVQRRIRTTNPRDAAWGDFNRTLLYKQNGVASTVTVVEAKPGQCVPIAKIKIRQKLNKISVQVTSTIVQVSTRNKSRVQTWMLKLES